jgi:hypothetical protein
MSESQIEWLCSRKEIADVVASYCRGVDRLDLSAVRACYHSDGIDHHTGFDGNADDYVRWIAELLPSYKGTMHIVGNHFAEIRGEKARAETYGTAHHWSDDPHDPTHNFVSGFRYVDDFERRDGVWRIKERWAIREWTRAIDPKTVRAKEGVGPSPSRDFSDLVYRNF